MIQAPRGFVSYSHDSQTHKDWVLKLATRLLSNGVDVILDQWDLRLGGDLPRFMETGLSGADHVLAICTDIYVQKANKGIGGVGYEKMILTAQLMQDVTSERVIPIVRANLSNPRLSTFLGARVYIDFSDDDDFEEKYTDLIRELHGEAVKARPALGLNPFGKYGSISSMPVLSTQSERYVSPSVNGLVEFDYSNNDGRFVIGSGNMAFETVWSSASSRSIHAYRNSPSIVTIALAVGVESIEEIADATLYDTSSRNRTPRVGEIVIWKNCAGYFAATKVESVSARSHGAERDNLVFSYVIQSNKSADFMGG